MHPAPSLILFTTLSGLGFGMLVWLGLADAILAGSGLNPLYFMAVLLCICGLAASTFHLGHPERAWRAFTQWRSSWLSREAWAASAALGAAGLHILLQLLDIRVPALGILVAVLALVTIGATAMIYAQIRAVPRWHQPTTPALFLAIGLAGGAIPVLPPLAAAVLLLLAGIVQWVAWTRGDGRAAAGIDAGSATGLAGRGTVRAFEPPHTGRNYLLDEMVYRVGRKHAGRLRWLSLAGLSALPAVLLLVVPSGGAGSAVALLLHVAGVLAARWLFFAQAEHAVGVYYGR